MGKPIEFERFAVDCLGGGRVAVGAWNREAYVNVSEDDIQKEAAFTDPAKLDALADAIKRAAAALRKSQVTTFSDLEPGEWFRVAEGEVPRQKLDARMALDTRERVVYPDGPSTPVVRLVATFTHVTEGEGR